MIACVSKGYFQQEIHESAFQYQRQVERKERYVVGVNCFQSEAEAPVEIQKIDLSGETDQKARLQELRARRDAAAVERTLAEVKRRAAGTENLLPAIYEAVKAYATVGEISDALRGVFGTYRAVEA